MKLKLKMNKASLNCINKNPQTSPKNGLGRYWY